MFNSAPKGVLNTTLSLLTQTFFGDDDILYDIRTNTHTTPQYIIIKFPLGDPKNFQIASLIHYKRDTTTNN